jgi:hypothetical protein
LPGPSRLSATLKAKRRGPEIKRSGTAVPTTWSDEPMNKFYTFGKIVTLLFDAML